MTFVMNRSALVNNGGGDGGGGNDDDMTMWGSGDGLCDGDVGTGFQCSCPLYSH